MKKVCLAVLPALTIVLELLPLGAVCIFATSPTERVKETFSYFSLTPFGYANFAPLITATLTVAIFLLSLFSLKKKGVLKALFVLSIITVVISLFAIDVWLKLLYPCRSLYNSNTCNRKYFWLRYNKSKAITFRLSDCKGRALRKVQEKTPLGLRAKRLSRSRVQTIAQLVAFCH